jgi:YggT family protein
LFFGGGCTGTTAASQVVCLLFTFLTIAIFLRAILSWFNMDPRSPLIQILDAITEPIMDPIRRIMPRLGMLDLSPLVAILLLQFVSSGLQNFLG